MPGCRRHRNVVADRHVHVANRHSPHRIAWMLGAMLLLAAFLMPGAAVLAAPRTQSATPVAATPVAAGQVESVAVYFVRHDWFENDVVAAARREIAVAPGADDLARSAAVLGELTADPAETERAAGLTITVPESSDVRVLAIEDGTARVEVSARLTADATEAERALRLAQIVFTLTRMPTVERVQFLSAGGPVTDPLRVQGTANTYEGEFHVRVDATGAGQEAPLVDEQVVRASGSGTPGAFDEVLDLPDDASGAAILVVFQVAPDAAGTIIDITEIPIVLAP